MSPSAAVTVADILELRADGLREDEVWSILCQTVQALQDMLLTGHNTLQNENILPLITPTSLHISSRGRVSLHFIKDYQDEDNCKYLAPEYKRQPSCSDWEKVWIYSLGKTLIFSLQSADRNKKSSLNCVLNSMVADNPAQRTSLLLLLKVISEHCKTSLLSKPFSHLVVELYREVFGTPPQCLQSPIMSESPKEIQPIFASLCHSPTSDSTVTYCSRKSSVTSSVASKCSYQPKRNPVQRAPSRLYKAPADQPTVITTKYAGPNTCIGPEFIVRASNPPKIIHVGDVKASRRRRLTVIALNGQKIELTCDPAVTVGHIFEIMVQTEQLEDNFTLGLACLMCGDFVFLTDETKLHKVGPTGWKQDNKINFVLYLRVKFFLPSLRGVRSWSTKHLLYLQLRRSILEQQIRTDVKDLLLLGGLALQAEFGDFSENEHGCCDYFILEHYIPEELMELEDLKLQLIDGHRCRVGLDPGRAEELFISYVQRLSEYGCHHYTASWVRRDNVDIMMWVAINGHGVFLYEKKKYVRDRKLHEAFIWKHIQKLSYDKCYFYLLPHDVAGQKATNYKLKMDGKKSFYFFRLASLHHQFFLKLRVELSSLQGLSREFGISLNKHLETRNNFYVESKPAPNALERLEYQPSILQSKQVENIEEYQNKENENPRRKRNRGGVKMGVRAFNRQPCGSFSSYSSNELLGVGERRESLSDVSNNSSLHEAYILNSSIKSIDEKFHLDFHETMTPSLAEKFDKFSFEERVFRTLRLVKDSNDSLGIQVAQGSDGGVYIQRVLPGGPAEKFGFMNDGDKLVAVNGQSLLNMKYEDALQVLKTSGEEVEIVLSQVCSEEILKSSDLGTRFYKFQKNKNVNKGVDVIAAVLQKPIETEYLKTIRYEVDQEESNMSYTQVPLLITSSRF